MQVEAGADEAGGIDAQLPGVGPDVGEGDLRRLLHDVAQLPGEREPLAPLRRCSASTVSTSPPAPVTANPVTTPATSVCSTDSRKKRGRPSQPRTSAASTPTGAVQLVGHQLRRHLAQEAADLALERAHARLARVVGHDGRQRGVGDGHLVAAEPGPAELPVDQVVPGDGDLLGIRVAVQPDDLEPIEQCGRRDRAGGVSAR